MKKLILFTALVCFGLITNNLKAQDSSGESLYKHAIGFKVSGMNAVTYKKFLKPNIAFDLYGGMRWFNAPMAGILIEAHKYNMFGLEEMAMYYGGGLHGGVYTLGGAFVGVDGVFGFEYDFRELIDFPVSASIDVMGGVDVGTFGIPFSSQLSVRYILE